MLWKLKSGCDFKKLCKKYCSLLVSHSQAEPPKTESQLFGGEPSGLGSAQTYQSDFELSLFDLLILKKG